MLGRIHSWLWKKYVAAEDLSISNAVWLHILCKYGDWMERRQA